MFHEGVSQEPGVSTAQAGPSPLNSEPQHSKARWVNMRDDIHYSVMNWQVKSGAESGPGLVQAVLPRETGEKAGDYSIGSTIRQF